MGISIWQLVIVLVIVLLLFGTKKLRNIGGDLGGAIKTFRKAVKDPEADKDNDKEPEKIVDQERVIDGEVTSKDKDKV